MLKINNIDKYYNKHKKNKIHVINHTSIELENNGLVALLGPSGCGKTTLLNVIGGLDNVDQGSIYINNEKMTPNFTHKIDKIRNINIGYIFQDYKLIDNLSVYDNVAFVLKILGIKDKNEIKEKVEYALECVGMLRYKKRPASMLSGGERQRVGIARAIVKDPSIILADEPTGNLDSKNSLEIMKIIKAISEKRLVILVTHEQNLAKFYATRIIEIEDGTIKKDYINTETSDLDYEIDNCFYLKDFREKIDINGNNVDIDIYRNNNEKIKLEIVIKNDNIYIKSNEKLKPEIVNDDTNIEFIDSSYQKLSHTNKLKYNFDFDKIKSNNNKKYVSIINPFSLILEGFKKVLDYHLLKKILLIGFFIAGMFIIYSVSTYMATLQVKEEEFIKVHKEYLTVETNKINISVPLKDYYQTNNEALTMPISLASTEVLEEENIIDGKLPSNSNEVVLDKLAFDNIKEKDPSFQMAGLINIEDMLNRKINIDKKEYTIVGITDDNNPCLYVDKSQLLSIIALSNTDLNKSINKDTTANIKNLLNYNDDKDKIQITNGKEPANDYEIIINKDNSEGMPLNKEIEVKLNGKKLKVVGYYTSKYGLQEMYTNANTFKYLVLISKKSFTIMPKNKEEVLEKYHNNKSNIIDTYKISKKNYIKEKRKQTSSTIIISGIILIISFIEIYLMIRSSFLSRIKEIGIYRAIGLKRIDICKMFIGEIVAITTMSSMPGLIFMAYILHILSRVKSLNGYILMNSQVLIISFILVYTFNIIVGLLPVINTIRKKPAEILSRTDL